MCCVTAVCVWTDFGVCMPHELLKGNFVLPFVDVYLFCMQSKGLCYS